MKINMKLTTLIFYKKYYKVVCTCNISHKFFFYIYSQHFFFLPWFILIVASSFLNIYTHTHTYIYIYTYIYIIQHAIIKIICVFKFMESCKCCFAVIRLMWSVVRKHVNKWSWLDVATNGAINVDLLLLWSPLKVKA